MANLFSTNLPLQLTSFIGRAREIADVKRLLGTTRLLTLTGAGGCGKTRLALHVAENLLDAFPDGVWFVDLAPLSDPTLISQTIASIFDLHESAETIAIDLLKNYLHTKNVLLVLDNCEHLIAACAQLSDTLLRACPELKIFATSREALNIAGEISFRVPSLTLPDLQNLPPVGTLAHYESIQLF
ncbi:MAG TPA: AAA family ATPase, partial [Anaerolineae bacterium]